jgi:DNA-binding transcriptional ArsR family regulator/precorrin-6B methylase 2
MTLEQIVSQLDAAAEPSRLRLLVALVRGETTVGDLVTVLQQSQPRVSRHLRLLLEAGLVESFREGRSVYYRWSAAGLAAGVASPVATLAASDDPTITADRQRLQALSRERERGALRRALRARRARGLHLSDGAAAIGDLVRGLPGGDPPGDVLVVGCGSGELIRVLLPAARLVMGTEPSGYRRQVARARLRQSGVPHWTIRDAEATALPVPSASFDIVILQDVLAAGAEAAAVLGEAVRVLREAGRLVILDRVLPTDVELSARLAALGCAITRRQWLPGRAPDRAVIEASRGRLTTARTGTHD